jgi:hypothetical protein
MADASNDTAAHRPPPHTRRPPPLARTQVYKVIKPGTYFSTYEWLRTPKYDASNAQHVSIVDGVAEGNALPAVRTVSETLAAGAAVGFELIRHEDIALTAQIPWQAAMRTGARALSVTQRALSVTQRALSVTQRALSVTQRALSVTPASSQRHPASSQRHPASS